MPEADFTAFEARSRADGFDEVLERAWPPGLELATHTHDFAVRAQVVRGQMWLTVGDATRELGAGDTFVLDAGIAHAERYGPEGAAYWVARRHPRRG